MGRRKAPEFGEFWRAYPVHKARAAAERAWARLTATDRTRAVAGIPAYREECLRTGVALCYGQRYLSDRRWTDEGGDVRPKPAAPDQQEPEDMEIW